MTNLKQVQGEVILCCGKGGCPRIKKFGSDKVKITDDFGSTVVLDKEQALLIQQAIKQLDD
jgi:hypothetical protein|tara:strand:+ start:5713 stop:5895 length:183 start_codon:yes stop_codon:yes gene_type:complete